MKRTIVLFVATPLLLSMFWGCDSETNNKPEDVESESETSISCGDNRAEGTEPCDGSDLRSERCVTISQNYTGGTLSCLDDCSGFDISQCQNVLWCSPESCDGCCDGERCRMGQEQELCGTGGLVCEDCGDNGQCVEGACFFPSCGDNVLSEGEDSDGSLLGEASCGSLGFLPDGELSCIDCRFDTSDCSEACNRNTYTTHCEGNDYLRCDSGAITREICTEEQLCRDILWPDGTPWADCYPMDSEPCDSETYVDSCNGDVLHSCKYGFEHQRICGEGDWCASDDQHAGCFPDSRMLCDPVQDDWECQGEFACVCGTDNITGLNYWSCYECTYSVCAMAPDRARYVESGSQACSPGNYQSRCVNDKVMYCDSDHNWEAVSRNCPRDNLVCTELTIEDPGTACVQPETSACDPMDYQENCDEENRAKRCDSRIHWENYDDCAATEGACFVFDDQYSDCVPPEYDTCDDGFVASCDGNRGEWCVRRPGATNGWISRIRCEGLNPICHTLGVGAVCTWDEGTSCENLGQNSGVGCGSSAQIIQCDVPGEGFGLGWQYLEECPVGTVCCVDGPEFDREAYCFPSCGPGG